MKCTYLLLLPLALFPYDSSDLAVFLGRFFADLLEIGIGSWSNHSESKGHCVSNEFVACENRGVKIFS